MRKSDTNAALRYCIIRKDSDLVYMLRKGDGRYSDGRDECHDSRDIQYDSVRDMTHYAKYGN